VPGTGRRWCEFGSSGAGFFRRKINRQASVRVGKKWETDVYAGGLSDPSPTMPARLIFVRFVLKTPRARGAPKRPAAGPLSGIGGMGVHNTPLR
jgi:hypothetical protein